MRSSSAKYVALVVWLVVLGTWLWHLRQTGTTPVDSAQGFIDAIDGAWWAIPAFIAVYLARPLLLFPASILTVAAGILFGPVLGILVAVVAANGSALVAYQVAKSFSPEAFGASGGSSIVDRWSGRMRDESFLTVMVMRLAYLPYDVVNYAAGYLRIDRWAFLAATALGSLPGTVSFVLAGASLERLDEGLDGFDPWVFGASVAIFIVSVVASRGVRRRTQEAMPASAAPPAA